MIEVRTPIRLHPVERLRPPLRAAFAALWDLCRRRPLVAFIAAMLALDAAFIAIQIAVDATHYGFNGAYRLSLETEMGIAQFYGWAKAGAAAYFMWLAWRRFRSPTAALWAAALAYLGIDDALRLHERLGGYFADTFAIGEVGPLRGQDVGEVIAYLVILSAALAALLFAEHRDRGAFPTMLTMTMIPLVGGFVFFAVVLDTIGGSILPSILEIAVEDGGELIALTLLFAAAAVWSQQADEMAEAAGA
jgi:hypothetical protein